MAGRVRLTYEGIKYDSEALFKISTKEAMLKNGILMNYRVSRNKGCVIVTIKDKITGKNFDTNIPFDVLKLYKGLPVSVPTKKKEAYVVVSDREYYSKNEILEIGQQVACLWGAYCIDCRVDKRKREVIFDCNEHGENFITTVKFSELKEYADKLGN